MGAADTLRQLIDAGKGSTKRLDELSSARVIGKVALQIHAAQQKAGAGKAVGPITPSAITLAPSGEVTFTPVETSSLGYSAPEQLSGSGDRRSDVFSLGTVLWEVLTYQRLFDAMNDAAVKVAVKEREITPPAEANANVPAELSAICMRALHRNPADRYQSLKSMAVEIEEFLSEAGYEDNDDKIAHHLAHMPRTLKLDTTPPLNRTAGGTQPPPLSPTSFSRPGSASQPPPSILTAPPVTDAPKPSSGAALAAKLQGASSSATAVGVPAAPAPEPVPLVPMPPVLPGQASVRNDKSTISVSVPPQVKVATTGAVVVEAKHESSKPHAVIVEEKPQALIVEDDPKQTAPGLGQTMREPAKVEPATVEPVNGTATVELKKPLEAPPVVTPTAKSDEAAKTDDTKAPERKKAPTSPHPVAAVSLGPGPRESKADVLAGWGWGTDKHNAIPPEAYAGDDEDFHAPPDSKKTLLYVIGGGVAVAALVTIIALAAGGSKDNKKKPNKPVASAQAVEQTQPAPTPPPAPPPDPTPAAGSAVDTQGSAGSATPAIDPAAAEQAAADKAAADKAAADKAAADQAIADKADAEQAAADKKAQEKLAAEQAAAEKRTAAEQAAADKKAAAEQAAADKKAAAAQALADKKAAEQAAAEKRAADKAAAAQALAEKRAADKAAADQRAAEKKAAADKLAAEKKALAASSPKKDTRPATTTTAKTTPKVAKADTKKTETKTEAKTEGKVDVEAAYRQGIQQFARGDTAGALASLRTSLASNPNYAPTWRGLGLVFEKMGETQQARAAFKRYLQLAPGANDSEQIKGRLERLGS